MKRAPWVGLAAIGVLLATVGWAKNSAWGELSTDGPLDFRGIDTLEVHAWQPDIELQADATALRYEIERGEGAEVRREGSTLVVTVPRESGYVGLTVHAPASLRRIVLDGGDIVAMAGVGAMTVESRGDVSWTGDATALQVFDRGAKPGCKANCRNTLKFHDGEIGEVFARTRGGTVSLDDARHIGVAILALGDEADFALGNLHELPTNVRVVGYEVEAPPAAPATQLATPDDPPPRE